MLTVSGASQVAVVWGPATADPASKLLVCYLVAKRTPDADELGQIAARLPVYMAPQAYHLLQAMPLSANGKVDYRALQTQLLNDYP